MVVVVAVAVAVVVVVVVVVVVLPLRSHDHDCCMFLCTATQPCTQPICPNVCPNGYVYDSNGCQTCRCVEITTPLSTPSVSTTRTSISDDVFV